MRSLLTITFTQKTSPQICLFTTRLLFCLTWLEYFFKQIYFEIIRLYVCNLKSIKRWEIKNFQCFLVLKTSTKIKALFFYGTSSFDWKTHKAIALILNISSPTWPRSFSRKTHSRFFPVVFKIQKERISLFVTGCLGHIFWEMSKYFNDAWRT